MAITSSTIRIYSDSALHNLVKTVTTQGAGDAIDVTNLSEGSQYWATVQITEDGLTSDESTGYMFTTLPDCFFDDSVDVQGTGFAYSVDTTTDYVRITKCGVMFGDTNQQNRPRYDWIEGFGGQGFVSGLAENTEYDVTPVVMDVYGRIWVNSSDTETIRTTVAKPAVEISGLVATTTTVTGFVNVVSSAQLTGLTVMLRPVEGGSYINVQGVSAVTGIQKFTVSGLQLGTAYNVYAIATNAGGSDTATASVITRYYAEPYINITYSVVDSSTVDLTFSYDGDYPIDTSNYSNVHIWYGEQGCTAIPLQPHSLANGVPETITVTNLNQNTVYFAEMDVDYYDGEVTTSINFSTSTTVPTVAITSITPVTSNSAYININIS